jgi:hypothetical protein
MLFVMRFSLPDRPGTLGAVATAISHVPASIVTLRVVERQGEYAIDEAVLEAVADEEKDVPEAIRRAAEGVPAVTVECVRRIQREPDPLASLILAERLSHGVGSPLLSLVDALPESLPAAWAIAFDFTDGVKVLASSPSAPVPRGLDPPWLPLVGARRLHYGEWMPQSWRMVRLELAAVPWDGDAECIVVGRWAGMQFRDTELRQLEILTGLALRSARMTEGATLTP